MQFRIKTLIIATVLIVSTVAVVAQEAAMADASTGLKPQRFRVEMSAGMGRQFFKNDANWTDAQKAYAKRLRGGIAVDGSLTYFPNEKFGVGGRVGSFFTNYSVENADIVYADGSKAVGTISDNIRIAFYGLNLVYRKRSVETPGNALFISAAVGYTMYTNFGALVNPIKLSGNAPGVCLGIAYDLRITDHLSAGANATLWETMLKEIDANDGKETKTISLDKRSGDLLRGSLTVGLRYSL